MINKNIVEKVNMSGKSIYPTAPYPPPDDDGEEFHRGAPPPSYEESLKMSGPAAAPPHPYSGQPYYQPPQQAQAYHQFPPQQMTPMNSYGYVNPYQAHIQQQQTYYNTASASTSHMSPSHVLHFDKRAQIRTTATGAITVPPPPPGCAPTPAQLAAMAGEPVTVKQKKRFFF